MKLLLPVIAAPLVVLGTFAALLLFTDGCGPSQPSAAQPNPAAALCIAHRTTKELECVDLNVDKPSIDACRKKVQSEIECVDAGASDGGDGGSPNVGARTYSTEVQSEYRPGKNCPIERRRRRWSGE